MLREKISKEALVKLRKKFDESQEQNTFWNNKELEVGAEIYGWVANILEARKMKNGKQGSRVMLLDTGEGVVRIYLKTVLDSQVAEKGICVGDLIGIRYLGKIKNYYNYIAVKISN